MARIQAQDTILTIEQVQMAVGHQIRVCADRYDRVLVYAPEGCTSFIWAIDGGDFVHDVSPIIFDGNISNHFLGLFDGCGYNELSFEIWFIQSNVPNEYTSTSWKRPNEAITLAALGSDSIQMYSYHWSTGATTSSIEVTDPGTYTCGISDLCATATRTFIVRDNVELYRATVDLETNLNKVTWQTTTEQAEYVSQVKVERNGMVVGTAAYADGFYLDAIGSENAARTYRLTGITADGTECPIPSYQKGTLHVDYSPNANDPNKINMAWTPPFIEEGAGVAVSYFQICKYDPSTGEVEVKDQLGPNVTIGSYNVSLFDGGYATVAALFSESKTYEEMSFSNLTDDIFSTEENEAQDFKVYPNPSTGSITLEGTGRVTVTNLLGQTVKTFDIEAPTTIKLPQGVFFIKMNGHTQRVVVE